jgi:hypothetical protein
MAHFVGTPEMESRNCPDETLGTLNCHNSRPQSPITTKSESKLYFSSRYFQRHVAHSNRMSGRGRFPTFSDRESNWQIIVPALLLPITWAADVQIANARPFSISTFQDLSNDTNNTPMRGVLSLAVELSTFGSPGGLQIPNFSKCWASPPHLAKVGLRQQ